MTLLIGELFRRNAEVVPQQVAASLGSAQLTHAELDAAGNRLAHVLRELGVRHGDRVVSWADTCLEVLPLFVALAKLGAVFAPLNARLGAGATACLSCTTLDCAGAIHRLEKPLQSARFSGDDQTVATLHGGPVKDFNIMVQRQLCRARVSSAQQQESTIDVDADILLVYAVDGELSMIGPEISVPVIPPGHLCVVQDPASGSLLCRGASHIVVQINHHAASD